MVQTSKDGIPGEVISESSIEVMKYYGIETVRVVKE